MSLIQYLLNLKAGPRSILSIPATQHAVKGKWIIRRSREWCVHAIWSLLYLFYRDVFICEDLLGNIIQMCKNHGVRHVRAQKK